jgi:membrane protein
MDLLGENVPGDVASTLRDQIDSVINSRNAGLISISIAAAIWSASGGVATLMKGMNRIYRESEKRAFWMRYALAVGLTLLAGTFLIVAFLVMILGQVYGLRIADELGLEGVAAQLFTWARLPLVFLVVLLSVDFLYWVAPSAGRRFRIVSPGSLLFTLAWLGLNLVFGLYVSRFGSFNATYGALAGVVVVLLWFYLTSFLLLIGAETDAVVIEKVDKRRAPAVDPNNPHEDVAEAAG